MPAVLLQSVALARQSKEGELLSGRKSVSVSPSDMAPSYTGVDDQWTHEKYDREAADDNLTASGIGSCNLVSNGLV